MPVARPSVISSMLRAIWVTSATPSRSTVGKENPAFLRTALRLSDALFSQAVQPSTAQTASAELTHVVLEVPIEVELHVQTLLPLHLSFFKQQFPVLFSFSKHLVNQVSYV